MKGILIVDNMPQGCNECKYLGFQGETEKRACMLTTNSLFIQNVDELDIGRDISCPLKPLPEPKDEHVKPGSFNWDLGNIINAENRGYNRCLEELLGEDNESCTNTGDA